MTGTFLTQDGGLGWRMLKFNGTTMSIAFDPADTETLYVGTNNGNVFRSVDGGQAWSLLYPAPSTVIGERFVGDHGEYEIVSNDTTWVGPTSAIMSIVVDPDDDARLFLAAAKGTSTFDLLRSIDHGNTWSKVRSLSGFTGFGGFIDLFVDPASSAAQRRLFAFTTDEAAIVDVELGTAQPIKPPAAASGRRTPSSIPTILTG